MQNLRLTACFTTQYDRVGADTPMFFEFNAKLPTKADAVAFAAQFPKSAKLFGCTLSGSPDGYSGWVVGRGNLTSNGVNGGVNETAVKRYATIVKAAAKLGIEIEYRAIYGNSYPSREAFEAAIS